MLRPYGHAWLINNIPMDTGDTTQMARMRICVQWENSFLRKGTPQGGIISPTLPNMALDGLQDLLLEKSVKKYQGELQKIVPKIHLVRYADDFIVTAKDLKKTIERKRLYFH